MVWRIKHRALDREAAMPKLFVMWVLVGVIGCNRSTAPLVSTPAGSYVLRSVDSKPVPTQQTAGDSILTGGAVLYENGSYAINWLAPSYYFNQREVIAAKDTGTWTGAPEQLSFTSTTGSSWTGTFANGSLTLQLAQDTWTFVRP
jgi:hypothetical protein